MRKDKNPIFEVILTTPSPNVSYRDGSIKIKVKIKVKVKSAIVGSSGFSGTLVAACYQHDNALFHHSMRIIDEVIFDIDFKNDLKLDEITDSQSFLLFVDFIDDATNKTFSASTSFSVEMSDYSISIVHSPQYFKPGIPYSFTILVTRVNGFPMLNSELPIEVSVKDDDNFLLLNGNYSLDPSTGGVEVDVFGIPMSAAYLKINAKYDKVKYAQLIYRSPSNQNQFVSINVLTPR